MIRKFKLPAMLAVLALSLGAMAQDFRQPIRVVVPFAAGGATDVVARLLAPGLSKELGQPVLIDNRPGASGQIGAALVKNAPPDGSTFLFALDHSLVIVPLITPSAGYDALRDFTPVGTVTRFQWAFEVPLDSPAKTLAEFIELVKKSPEHRSFGVPVIGGMPELLGRAIGQKAGVRMEAVPFPGSAQMVPLLLGDQLPAGITGSPEATQLARAEKVRVLAITGEKRSPLLPGVPTFDESGLPNLTIASFNAFFAPRKLPQALAEKFNAALRKSLQSAELKQKIADMALDLVDDASLEASARELQRDHAFWNKVGAGKP